MTRVWIVGVSTKATHDGCELWACLQRRRMAGVNCGRVYKGDE